MTTEKDKSLLPRVHILAMGGTIAGVAPKADQMSDYKAGSLTVQTLINAVPELNNIAHVTGEQVAAIGSQNLNDCDIIKLAKRANEVLAEPDVVAVVVTHGTATLEESAYFLNLTVRSQKPVVVVGAQRPATAISADGPLNLLNAVRLAIDPQARGKGVLIAMNDMFGGAREVTKTNTTNVSTFKSFELGVFGYMAVGQNWFVNQSLKKHTYQSEFDVREIETLPRVDIVYSHINADRVPYDSAVNAGAQGIVIAGTGNGAFHNQEWPGILDAIKNGVTIVRSSRIPCGPVTFNHKEWADAGMIHSGTLNPQKARILLQLALTKTHNAEEIQRIFNKY